MKLHALKSLIVEARNHFRRIFDRIPDAERTKILRQVMAVGAAGCVPGGPTEELWARIPPALRALILQFAAAKAAETEEDYRMRGMETIRRTRFGPLDRWPH